MLGICGISRLHRHVTGMAIKQKSGNVAFGVAIVGHASLEACPFCFADLLRFGDQFVPETKTEWFCNIFAIANSLLSLQSGNKPLCSRFRCIFGPQFVIGGSEQSLIAKKLQFWSLFCFWFLVCFETMSGRDKPDVAHG